MVILFVILVILACVVLGLVVLVQNPKGGGLAANIGGISNQFMGVKQTTDVLEKGTWIFAAVIGVLCLASTFFITPGASGSKAAEAAGPPSQTQQPTSLPGNSPVQPTNPNPGK